MILPPDGRFVLYGLLITAAIYDVYNKFWIPDWIAISGLTLRAMYSVQYHDIGMVIIYAVAGFLTMFLIGMAVDRLQGNLEQGKINSIGGADIKLMAMIGGWEGSFEAIIKISLVAAMLNFIAIAIEGRMRKERIMEYQFAPQLAIATIVLTTIWSLK